MATTEERLKEYEDLFKKTQAYDINKYQEDFQKAYNEAVNYNQDLIQKKAQSLGELQAVAPTLREKYANSLITDPTVQMSLIAQARQAPITNWGQAVDLLNVRGAKYSDILGKALGGYQTAAEQANTAAENAWRLYQDAVAQQEAARARAASSGGGIDLASLLGLGGGTTQQAGTTGGGYVDDRTLGQKAANWTDKLYASDWLGADLTKAPTSIGGAVLKGLQVLNPLTYIKTGAGLLGNLIGSRGSDRSFIDKLLNRR